jgi:hypothetical protein
MKSNLGYQDRVLRAILGGLIMAAGAYFKNWWGLVGGVLFFTSVFSFCPIYFTIGINSLKKKIVKKQQ